MKGCSLSGLFYEARLSFELFTLFVSAFVSATLFPGGSELLFIYHLSNTPQNSCYYFLAVTLGNSLGAVVTYWLGYYCGWGRDKLQAKHEKALRFCKKHGAYALLLSWLPIVGDLLPLAAGWLKLGWLKSAFFILSGKALRYGLLWISTLYFI